MPKFSIIDTVAIGVFIAIVLALAVPVFIDKPKNADFNYAVARINIIIDEIPVYQASKERLSKMKNLDKIIAPVVLAGHTCLRVKYVDLVKIKFEIDTKASACTNAWNASKHKLKKELLIANDMYYYF